MSDLAVTGVNQNTSVYQIEETQTESGATRELTESVFDTEGRELQTLARTLGVEKELDNVLYLIKHSNEDGAIKHFKLLCKRLESDSDIANLSNSIVFHNNSDNPYVGTLASAIAPDNKEYKDDNLRNIAYTLLQTRLDEQEGKHVDLRDYITDNCTDRSLLTWLTYWTFDDETDVLREICGL